MHKYTGGGSSEKEIPKMSLELSQVTKKHAGDFGPLSRWYFLRGVYCEKKKVEIVYEKIRILQFTGWYKLY